MAGSTPNPSDVFDVRKVRRLVELMNEYDLNALDLQQGDQRIRLRRGAEQVETNVAAPVAAAPATSAAAPVPADSSIAASNPDQVEITSPMVGSFYTAANPDAAPFVKIGDQVGPETTVCIVEAMKVFNQIPAEVTGRIVAVLVENGDPVEYGQPLFRVNTAQ